MKYYALSGLGADKRAYQFLTLTCELVHLDWIDPRKNESIESYAKRLSKSINTDEEFGLIGVSFGGMIAAEISKILEPKLTILISSAATRRELHPFLRFMGKTGLTKILSPSFFDPPRVIAHYLFGTKQNELLNQILEDTDLLFAKWAINAIVNWKNEIKTGNLIKISGTKDKLIPPRAGNEMLIDGGSHFMIVDRAEEVSEVVNSLI